MQISKVTSDDCQKLLNKLIDDGASHSAVKKVYDALNACFTHALINEHTNKNPMLTVLMPPKSSFDTKDVRALTEEEEKRLLTELDRTWVSSHLPIYNYKDAFIIMLNTGIRQGEMVALDWEDVDLNGRSIHIHKNAIVIKMRDKDGTSTGEQKQIVQYTPKTKSGNREIPLNKKALAALQRLKDAYPESPYVLTTTNNTRVYYNTLNKQFSKAVQRCMIPNAGIHTLRHTFATRLFEKDANVKDVSVLLGHASTSITFNTYIHIIKERKQDVVGLLDE